MPAPTDTAAPRPLTLALLAAGVGARFGGLKQFEAMGPNGEWLLEYSVFDALRAGFSRFVVVIQPETDRAVQAELRGRIGGAAMVEFVHQRLDDLPLGCAAAPARTKPWGTGHAALVATNAIDGSFALANADDYYGRGGFAQLAALLAAPTEPPTHALVAYPLGETLAEGGAVARAVCRCDDDGLLCEICEKTGLEHDGAAARFTDERGDVQRLPLDALVSMNLWGFDSGVRVHLADGFREFLRDERASEREYFLPSAVNRMIGARAGRVRVLRSADAWCGLTHRQDAPRVRAALTALVERGAYPRRLWR